MKHIWARFLVVSVFLTSCVTTHVGEELTTASGDLTVSCERRSNFAKRPFFFYSCAIENKRRFGWIDFEVASVRFLPDPSASNARISTAGDIGALAQAIRYAADKEQYNADLALAGAVVGGLVVAGLGGRDAATAGLAVAGLASGAQAASAISRAHSRAQNPGLSYSEEHLLGEGIRIPPRSFMRKFIVVETLTEEWAPKTIEICLKAPTNECLAIPIPAERNTTYVQ